MEQRRNPQRLSPQGGHVAGIPVKIAVAVEAATESGAFELGSVDIEVFLREPCELGDETGQGVDHSVAHRDDPHAGVAFAAAVASLPQYARFAGLSLPRLYANICETCDNFTPRALASRLNQRSSRPSR